MDNCNFHVMPSPYREKSAVAQPQSSRHTPFRLSATAYLAHSQPLMDNSSKLYQMPNNLRMALLLSLNTQISTLLCASLHLEESKQKSIREL
jgi:hypothetical protein